MATAVVMSGTSVMIAGAQVVVVVVMVSGQFASTPIMRMM